MELHGLGVIKHVQQVRLKNGSLTTLLEGVRTRLNASIDTGVRVHTNTLKHKHNRKHKGQLKMF